MISKSRIFFIIALLLFAFVEIRHLLLSRSLNNSKQSIEIPKEATATGSIQEAEMVTVAYVIDGDTISLTDGRRVRYIGIDAPEIAFEGNPAKCFGDEAKKENTKYVNGKKVTLEKDVSETDAYGRLLRYVYVDGVSVSEYLVKEGFAKAWNVPPDEKLKEAFMAAELEAEQSSRGLWQLCRT